MAGRFFLPFCANPNLSRAEATSFDAALWALSISAIQLLLSAMAGNSPATLVWFSIQSEFFISSCFLGTFVIFLARHPSRSELIAALGLGTVLESLLWVHRSQLQLGQPLWFYIGDGLGIAASLVLLLRLPRVQSAPRFREAGYLLLALFMPISRMASLVALNAVTNANPLTYDLFGYALDCALGGAGFHPAYSIAYAVLRNTPLSRVVAVIYAQLSLVMAIAIVGSLRHTRRSTFNATLAFIVAPAIVVFLYNFYPMSGYYFWKSDFPTGPLPPVPDPPFLIPTTPLKVRNCMPSMHTTWVLLVFYSVRHIGGAWRVGAALAVIGTLLGTLTVGHYFIDLVVAVPFTVFVIAIASSGPLSRERAACLLVGAGLTLLNLLLMRLYPVALMHHPTAFKVLALATVLLPLWLEHRLARAILASR